MGSGIGGKARWRLTLKKHIGRFALLQFASAVGNFREQLDCLRDRGRGFCPLLAGDEQSLAPGRGRRSRSPSVRTFCGLRSEPAMRCFQNLRAKSMTPNGGDQVAIPHQSNRILSCPAWLFSPWRQAHEVGDCQEKKAKRRNRHGVARAIESLRRVRMSLVPRSNRRERLLQVLHGEIERVS